MSEYNGQWPKWVDIAEGKRVIAANHEHATALTGKPYLPDGTIDEHPPEAPVPVSPKSPRKIQPGRAGVEPEPVKEEAKDPLLAEF